MSMLKVDIPKVDTPPSGGGYNLDVPDSKAPERPKFVIARLNFDYDLDIPESKAPNVE
jgi:hypothetical protein